MSSQPYTTPVIPALRNARDTAHISRLILTIILLPTSVLLRPHPFLIITRPWPWSLRLPQILSARILPLCAFLVFFSEHGLGVWESEHDVLEVVAGLGDALGGCQIMLTWLSRGCRKSPGDRAWMEVLMMSIVWYGRMGRRLGRAALVYWS